MEKLITSFGNTKLLLENKISCLENVGAFWKITGDEEIGVALATLINTMSDLSTLAQTFKPENELYYGGCLAKILSLLGNKREREFVCKGNSSNTTKPSEWKRLVDFLDDELIQREKNTLFEKSKKALIGDSKKSNKTKSFQHRLSGKPVICHFCSETGHVTTKNEEGQEVIQYYACKNLSSCPLRSGAKHYMKENYVLVAYSLRCDSILSITVLSCMFAQMTWGWHVLVFMRHRERNQGLLNKFKSDMIDKLTNEIFTNNINLSSDSGLNENHVTLTKEDIRDDTVFFVSNNKGRG